MAYKVMLTKEEFEKLIKAEPEFISICEYADGKETGRKFGFKLVSASKSIGGKKIPENSAKNPLFVRPEYYNTDTPYEPRKVIKAWGLDWNLGTALKYIERRGNKQGETTLKDLKKALTYIHFAVEDEEERLASEKGDK